MENKGIFSNRDKKTFTNMSENNEYITGARDYNLYSGLNSNEDNLYKQYKNNMLSSLNSKGNKEPQGSVNKKGENEGNVIEMTVPVKIKSDDKDDWMKDLKVTMIVNFPTPSKQHITINITDAQDPLFLYILEIGEQEFHYLKQELSLLIEFQHFPQKFFEMLEMCAISLPQDNNSFQNKSLVQSNYVNVLHHNSSLQEALLIIQEITQFRQLNHLILRFKPASDSYLKKYLATLVKDYKGKSENSQKENSRLNENLESCYRDIKSFKDELGSVKMTNSLEIENLKLEYSREINEMKEKFLEEIKIKNETKEQERQNLVGDYENKIEELNKKLESLNSAKLNLEDNKIKLEASERDLIGRNSILSSELKVYKEEVENLRSNTTNLNQATFSQEKTLTEFKIKNELLNCQLDEKEKNIQNLTQLVENLNKQKVDLEDNFKSIRNTNNKLEDKLQASIAEINKGNEIIQKLQADIKSQKEKLKLKQQAIKSQEQLINQKQNSYDDMIRSINDLKRENEKKDEEIKGNKANLEFYKLKLEEGEKVCEENAKVIRFLNQKLNESYQPFKNILKNDYLGTVNAFGDTNSINNNTNFPLSNVRNFKDDNMGNEINKNEFMNTGSSFGRQPYFNSMAFQSQGSFKEVNSIQNANVIIPSTNTDNMNGFILPETNFSNYKNNLNFNSADTNTNSNANKLNKAPNTNFSNTLSKNTNSNSNNLLSHKYGTPNRTNADNIVQNTQQSNRSNKSNKETFSGDQNLYNNNMNLNIEEEEPRQVPLSNLDKNIYQHKGMNKIK